MAATSAPPPFPAPLAAPPCAIVFVSGRRRHTRCYRDWSSDVCSSDLDLSEAQDALRTRDLLFDIFQEVSAALRADEIFQTLVRRVGHAFGLTHCSFVLTAPGEDKGRVVAVYENPAIRDLRVELERYPEIQEAIRTERPVLIPDVHEHPLFEAIRRHWMQQRIEVNVQSAVALPVFVQGRAAGVFFLRTVQGDPELRSQDVAFANP